MYRRILKSTTKSGVATRKSADEGIYGRSTPNRDEILYRKALAYQKILGADLYRSMYEKGEIQAKLGISAPQDPMEQEAERVAKLLLQSSPTAQNSPPASRNPSVQSSASNQKGTDPQFMQGGEPLSQSAKEQFETGLGQDLSPVRVHRGTEAESAAATLQARAFTYGNHIVLGEGARAENRGGSELLAHELVHVAQQSGTGQGAIQRLEESTQLPLTTGGEGVMLLPSGPGGLYTTAEREKMLARDRLKTNRGVYRRVERSGSLYFELEIGSGIVESLELDPSGSVIQRILPVGSDGNVGIPLSVRYDTGARWVIPLQSVAAQPRSATGSALTLEQIMALRSEVYQGQEGPMAKRGVENAERVGRELNIPPTMRGVWCAAMSEWAVLKAIGAHVVDDPVQFYIIHAKRDIPLPDRNYPGRAGKKEIVGSSGFVRGMDSIANQASFGDLQFGHERQPLTGTTDARYTALTSFLSRTTTNGVVLEVRDTPTTHFVGLLRKPGESVWRVFDASGYGRENPDKSITPAHGSLFDPAKPDKSVLYKTYGLPVRYDYFPLL